MKFQIREIFTSGQVSPAARTIVLIRPELIGGELHQWFKRSTHLQGFRIEQDGQVLLTVTRLDTQRVQLYNHQTGQTTRGNL